MPSTNNLASELSTPLFHFGVNVKALRAEMNWSTVEFAKHSGITRMQLYRIESSTQATVMLATVVSLARALGVQPSVLLTPKAVPRTPWSEENFGYVLAERLAEGRKAAQLTASAFAKLAGVPRETISRVEGATRGVTVQTMQKLACTLGLTAADLLKPQDGA